MRALVQRVSRAAVDVDGRRVAEIGPGLLVLLGITHEDGEREVDRLADKVKALRVQALAEPLVQRLGGFGPRRRDVGRPIALARVAVERELGHAQHLAVVAQRQVHHAVVIGKHPERSDLVGEAVHVFLAVLVRDPEQHQQPRPDLGDPFPVDVDRGPLHPLHQCSHLGASSLARAGRVTPAP